MKNIIVLCGIGLLMFLFYSCKGNPVDNTNTTPVDSTNTTPVEVKPGSRNYTWDITELVSKAYTSVSLFEIWGTSPSNIWAVGEAGESAYGIYHYDGSSWKNGANPYIGGGLSSIWGSSADNIWVGNAGGLLYKYNGSEWSTYTQLVLSGYDMYCIQHLWGVSANEIYASGAKIYGTDPAEEIGIFKYNGSSWTRIDMPKIYKNCIKSYKDKNGDLLILSTEYGNGNMYLYSWTGTELKTLFYSNNSRLDVCRIGEKTIITYNNKIYDYNSGDVKLLYDLSSANGTVSIACGRSEKDIFLIELDDASVNSIYHFNGTDAVEIYKFDLGVYPVMGCLFEKDVYILLDDYYTGKTKILHGKLNE
jgi:hypothetical protein